MTARIIPLRKNREPNDELGPRHIGAIANEIIQKIKERHEAAGVTWPSKTDMEQSG
jgi:hypothetical protein